MVGLARSTCISESCSMHVFSDSALDIVTKLDLWRNISGLLLGYLTGLNVCTYKGRQEFRFGGRLGTGLVERRECGYPSFSRTIVRV